MARVGLMSGAHHATATLHKNGPKSVAELKPQIEIWEWETYLKQAQGLDTEDPQQAKQAYIRTELIDIQVFRYDVEAVIED